MAGPPSYQQVRGSDSAFHLVSYTRMFHLISHTGGHGDG
jgi:hypothetical protein